MRKTLPPKISFDKLNSQIFIKQNDGRITDRTLNGTGTKMTMEWTCLGTLVTNLGI